MHFPALLRKVRQLGVRPHHQIWEIFLIRKINFLSFIAFLNCATGFIAFPLMGFDHFQWILGTAVILAPVVIFINTRWGYVAGSYGFFLIGIVVITYMSLLLGSSSYAILFFFPITLSIVQLLGRKETLIHMIVNLSLYLIAMIFLGVSYYKGLYQLGLSEDVLRNLRLFNIIVSGTTAMSFIIQITLENNRQEKMIKEMLREKEILLAEVFHRVKNNMNIVTSLLNLKMNTTESNEAQQALSDCRNRVFSMALVHEKIFHRGNISGLDFGQYARDLVQEISHSMALTQNDRITVHSGSIELPLQQAIPCGLILNELVTNSCKHARVPGRDLQIDIELKEEKGKRIIRLQDNGPGLKEGDTEKSGSMGVDLIRSLCEQIDGKYHWRNDNGFHFEVVF